jgi:ATP synthase protein I
MSDPKPWEYPDDRDPDADRDDRDARPGDYQPAPPRVEGPGMVRRAASARGEALRAAATLGSVGMSFTFAVIIGAVIGYWLDKWTGWSPLFFLIFLVVGFAAGALNVHRALAQVNKKP